MERGPLPPQHRGQYLARTRLIRPRQLSGDYLPDHDPEAVDIARVGASFFFEHLRMNRVIPQLTPARG